MAIEVFNRCEKKYMINSWQYERLVEIMAQHMVLDKYNEKVPFYQLCNIYYDTENDELIRNSIEKPIYKEKIRLRGYGTPELKSKSFVEIKKKYKGIVNKRRTSLPLDKAYDYLGSKKTMEELDGCDGVNPQIARELDYFKQVYSLVPRVYISYERRAYFGKDDGDFRVTFDKNITTRRHDLRLELGSYGDKLLPEGMYLMEVKVIKSVPMWFARALNELDIKPASFSKYGTEYKRYLCRRSS